MLSIGAMSGGQAGYYLGLAREDYYLEGGEPPGKWLGAGKQDLGLGEEVNSDQLYNLFDGFSPDGRRVLVQRQHHQGKQQHRPGWDLTFSAPKSVSVLWSQAPAEIRLEIQEAHFRAVKAALKFLETNATFTRRGSGGAQLEHCSALVAAFEHSTSRALDPQLHTHALLMNIGVRSDGTTGTLSSPSIFKAKMAAGALYRVELAFQLQQALGLEIDRHASWFEVSKVPKGLIAKFSKRREAIERLIAERGIASAKGAAAVTIETREVKQAASRMKLFKSWSEAGAKFGWSTSAVHQLLREPPKIANQSVLRECISRATDRLLADSAHFSELGFVRVLAEEAQGAGISAGVLLAAGQKHLQESPEIVPLGFHFGMLQFTTRAMLGLETQLMLDAESLVSDTAPKARSHSRETSSTSLSREQADAVRHLTTGSAKLAMVSGMAGTGKTTMLTEARRNWESQGLRVVGGSVAARAARQLQDDSGIPSTTVAKWLLSFDPYVESSGRLNVTAFQKSYGPDVLAPVRELARLYGPDILHPLRSILKKHGPNILQPFVELAEKHGPNVLEPFQGPLLKYSPDILQAWRALATYITNRVTNAPPVPRIDNKTVFVLDEAGMIDTPHMARLISVCREKGAKLVLIGDERQLQPIGPGAPFRMLCERFGRSVLTEVKRQASGWARRSVGQFARGDAHEALNEYAKRGLIQIFPNKHDAIRALVSTWHKDTTPLRDSLILSGTRDDAEALNRAAQMARVDAGELSGPSISIQGRRYFCGDRVMFTANWRSLGILNGLRGTIESVKANGSWVRVRLDSDERVSFDPRSLDCMTLGYAATTHKAQGATVARAYVLLGGPMQSRELSYVQASRAKESTQFFVPAVECGVAFESLARTMSQSHQKSSAIPLALKQVPYHGF